MPSNAEVRRAVEDVVETEIQRFDYDQKLSYKAYDVILQEVADDVLNRLMDRGRPEVSEDDRTFVQREVEKKVLEKLQNPIRSRFERFDRVVCKLGGEVGWAPGTIQSLDEEDPSDPTGQTKLPYVTKIDPPVGRLISVPYDENAICRAEVCFGQLSKGDLGFSLRCMPKKMPKTRRFAVGDRVACAVEDASCDFTIWSAGTVSDVNFDAEPVAAELGLTWNFNGGAGILPYRVLLDTNIHAPEPTHVYVHRDVHWLVRDLTLQPAAPRQAEDGTRNLQRLVKRRRGEAEWEMIDHETRRTRIQANSGDTTDDDDDDGDDAGAVASVS